jgi:hypothetical protein
MSAGRTAFQLGYQISPIILTGGIASLIPGGMLPIIAITQSPSFVLGLLHGNVNIDLDNYFAQFMPVAGATLINNQIGQYPFANQVVAANAIISQPNTVSMRMICPVRNEGGYVSKLTTITALQKTLEQHNASGGTYTVATPSFIYTNCILKLLRDTTPGEGKQMQTEWQFDFEKPLVALDTAQQVINSLLSKVEGQLPINGDPTWSGVATAVGKTLSNAVGSIIPSAGNLLGSLTGTSSLTNELF